MIENEHYGGIINFCFPCTGQWLKLTTVQNLIIHVESCNTSRTVAFCRCYVHDSTWIIKFCTRVSFNHWPVHGKHYSSIVFFSYNSIYTIMISQACSLCRKGLPLTQHHDWLIHVEVSFAHRHSPHTLTREVLGLEHFLGLAQHHVTAP